MGDESSEMMLTVCHLGVKYVLSEEQANTSTFLKNFISDTRGESIELPESFDDEIVNSFIVFVKESRVVENRIVDQLILNHFLESDSYLQALTFLVTETDIEEIQTRCNPDLREEIFLLSPLHLLPLSYQNNDYIYRWLDANKHRIVNKCFYPLIKKKECVVNFPQFAYNLIYFKDKLSDISSEKNGELHGYHYVFSRFGKLKLLTSWTEGKENGVQINWHDNGVMAYQCNRSQTRLGDLAQRCGVGIYWHDNGNMKTKVEYKDGKEDGQYEEWHSNGQRYKLCYYNNGQLHGKCEMWYSDGKPSLSCHYYKGKYHGQYQSWDRYGKVVNSVFYKARMTTDNVKS